MRIKQILLPISAQHNAWFMLSPNPQGLLLRTVLSTCYIVKREKNSCKSNPIGVWQGVGGSSKHTVLLYKENIIESVIFFFPSKKSISNQYSTCIKTKSSVGAKITEYILSYFTSYSFFQESLTFKENLSGTDKTFLLYIDLLYQHCPL